MPKSMSKIQGIFLFLASAFILLVTFSLAKALAKDSAPQITQGNHPRSHRQYKGKILVLLSGENKITLQEGTTHPTGFFLSELAGPALALLHSGYQLDFYTPHGNAATMDEISNNARWFKNVRAYSEALEFLIQNKSTLSSPHSLHQVSAEKLSQYVGIFVPGGHAPMEDLSHNEDVGFALNFFHQNLRPTALICHGPAALLAARDELGNWPYKGYLVTSFSTAEEKQEEENGDLGGHVLFYLEDELIKLGGRVLVSTPWHSGVTRYNELLTGQNPMSEEAFTEEFLKILAGK